MRQPAVFLRSSHRDFALAGLGAAAVALVACGEVTPPSPPDRPLGSTATAPVLLAAGDIAGCDHEGDLLTAAYINTVPEATVVTLGDNAYENGAASDYADCYDPGWGQFKARTRPALGNHEYNSGSAGASFDYFGAGAWGNSRPQGYYSFDLGTWHIIVLNDNSAFVPIGGSSAQVKWLQADLSANTRECVLAIWHQPRFYSEYPGRSPGNVASRKPFWTQLYSARADVVLHGHRHVYERYAPQDHEGGATPDGIRQFIVGTGGFDTWAAPTVLSPNVQVVHGGTQEFGVLQLTLDADSYSWRFVPVGDNTFTDEGTTSCHTGSAASPELTTAAVADGVTGKATAITVKTRDATGLALTTGGDDVVVQVSGANSATPAVADNTRGTYTARYTPRGVGADQVAITLNGVALAGSPFPSVVAPKIVKVGPSRFTQTGVPVGTAVPSPPSVKVTDAAGTPVAGVTVTFTVTAGGGNVSPASRVTNATGRATVDQWIVGPAPGPNQLRAAVSPASRVDFSATGQ